MTNETEAPERIWICSHLGEYGHYYPEAVEAEGEWGGVAIPYVPEARIAELEAQTTEAAIATIKANVPPLVWDEPDADPYQHQMSGAYEVTKLGHLYFHFIKRGDISTDLIGKFGILEAAKAEANAHHVAQLCKGMGLE